MSRSSGDGKPGSADRPAAKAEAPARAGGRGDAHRAQQATQAQQAQQAKQAPAGAPGKAHQQQQKQWLSALRLIGRVAPPGKFLMLFTKRLTISDVDKGRMAVDRQSAESILPKLATTK